VCANPRTAQAWDCVAPLYEPAPRDFVSRHKIATCNECGMLAMPDADEGPWCESETCQRSMEFEVYEAAAVQVLAYPLRAFVAKVGRTELAVRDRLAERGFIVSPITSSRDAYRVEHPRGAWTMQVHSRVEPILHAVRVAATATGETERRLIVMAAETLGARPDYAKTFRKVLPAESGVKLVADRQLVRFLEMDARRHRSEDDA